MCPLTIKAMAGKSSFLEIQFSLREETVKVSSKWFAPISGTFGKIFFFNSFANSAPVKVPGPVPVPLLRPADPIFGIWILEFNCPDFVEDTR